MIKNRFFFFTIVLLTMLAFYGCTNNTLPSPDDLIGSDLSNLLEKSMESVYDVRSSNIKITDYQDIDDHVFISYFIKNDNQSFHGVMYATKIETGEYEVVFNKGFEVSKNKPFTVNKIVSKTLGRIKQDIHLVTGYINDINISTIYVVYPNNEVAGLVLAEGQEVYTDIKIGINSSPKEVMAYSENGDLVYKHLF